MYRLLLSIDSELSGALIGILLHDSSQNEDFVPYNQRTRTLTRLNERNTMLSQNNRPFRFSCEFSKATSKCVTNELGPVTIEVRR